MKDLVRFFRRRDYLAVEAEPGVVEVVPIDAVSEVAGRARTLLDLKAWKAEHPDVTIEPVNGPVPL
ncbi:MAG: hypothetical protein H0U90_11490 [Actinobacteria bacterium]|nr:hypothetical protein [Actinomycetota bacterium]